MTTVQYLYHTLTEQRLMAVAKADKVQLLMLRNKVASAFFNEGAIYYNDKQNVCGKRKGGVKCLSYYAIVYVIIKVIHSH